MTPGLGSARWVVAASALAAPIANALLLLVNGDPAWPTLTLLAAGLLARAAAPASTVPLLVLLALAPVWQAGAGLATGSSDPQLLMPWLAGLAGWLAWPGEGGWRVTGIWRLGIASWALVVALTWPVVAVRELDFTLQTIGAATANGTLGATPERSAAFAALAAESQLVALLLFDWAWGAPLALRRRAWLALAPGLVAACGVAVWQQLVDPSVLSREPWIHLDRAAGTLYDANAMGALAALVGASLAAPSLSPRGVPRVLWSSAWAVAALAAVLATGSRTALAALVVCAAVAVLGALRGGRRLLAVAVVTGAVLVAGWVGRDQPEIGTGNAARRLAATAHRALQGDLGEPWRVAWHRDGYGPASMALIADHPWFGVGPGAFGTLITDYARVTLGAVLPPDNAQNWWRQQVADAGLIGGAGGLLCSWLALVAVVRWWRRSAAAPVSNPAPLVALGLMAFVSPPTQHPLLQVLIGLVVAHAVVQGVQRVAPGVAPGVARAVRAGTPSVPAPPLRRIDALVWAAALACVSGLAIEGWTAFRPPERASRFMFPYSYGLSAPVRTALGDGRWAARRSVTVVAPAGAVLVARVVLPHDDLARDPVTVTITDGHQVLCAHVARDQTPFECRVPVPVGRWPIVHVDVSRAWRTEHGIEQAALASGRFEP